MTVREKLHAAVDALPESELAPVLELVSGRIAPNGLDALLANAPIDDEPSNADENEEARQARAGIARGEFVGAEALRRELT